MPTENERKYVLINEPKVVHEIATKANRILAIEQAWLYHGKNWTYRIRKIYGPHYPDPIYKATFKQKVQKRLIEIETDIDERDYYDLLNLSDTILHKTRYIIPVGALKWEVDLFYNEKRSNLYFVMAEVELPEGTKGPALIPSFISDNLLFEVPADNIEFSSRKLQNIEYAIGTYNQLFEEKYNGE